MHLTYESESGFAKTSKFVQETISLMDSEIMQCLHWLPWFTINNYSVFKWCIYSEQVYYILWR